MFTCTSLLYDYYGLYVTESSWRKKYLLISLHALFQNETIIHINLTSNISSHKQSNAHHKSDLSSQSKIQWCIWEEILFFIICLAWSFEISLLASSIREINLIRPTTPTVMKTIMQCSGKTILSNVLREQVQSRDWSFIPMIACEETTDKASGNASRNW